MAKKSIGESNFIAAEELSACSDDFERREATARAALHDLRIQLRTIAECADVLLADAPAQLETERRALLDGIKAVSAAMLQILDDIGAD
ncbi:MAG TPA: hypothetical protein VMT58_09435 [Candidatus Binataceae bacterium]|nr:hypothetical protein [Candidatus Binataceae bacterium]